MEGRNKIQVDGGLDHEEIRGNLVQHPRSSYVSCSIHKS